jgi:hypothetical protein
MASGFGFDDVNVRRVYLNELRMHGRKSLAAEACGVSLYVIQNWKKHYDADGSFKAAEKLALSLRSESVARRLESEFIEGIFEPVLDRNSQPVMIEDPKTGKPTMLMRRKLETQARLEVLRRHDPAYRPAKDAVKEDSGKQTGALVVPGVVSVADWEKLVASSKEASKDQDS